MPNVHSTKPKAVRLPDGLEARIKQAAESDGETVNAFIVAAIEERLERRSGGSTAPAVASAAVAPPKRPRKPAAPAVKFKPEPETPASMAAIVAARARGER